MLVGTATIAVLNICPLRIVMSQNRCNHESNRKRRVAIVYCEMNGKRLGF